MTDQEDLILNADQQAVAEREIRNLHFAMATLTESLKPETRLSRELATNVLKVSEHYLADLGKALGVETQSAADIAERHAALREANLRIHQLEKQLGDSQAPELTQTSLKNLSDHLNRWWDLEGFGHISEINFGPYVCEVKFSCHLFGGFPVLDSDTPMTDKERKAAWLASLAGRGFEMGRDGSEDYVRDCDKSRETLTALFQQRLPSATVRSFESLRGRQDDFRLFGVTVFLRNIAEITALPVPAKKAD